MTWISCLIVVAKFNEGQRTTEGGKRKTDAAAAQALPVVLLMGPTAAGKTAVAAQMAAQDNYEIISVDSALVYRGMDIGTAKPDKATLQRTPHFLVDILDPSEPYSAAEFVNDATRLITQIHARGNVPLLCGGTMLYFKALTEGLSALPKANPVIRQQLTDEAGRKGWATLHDELQMIDPQAAARIHPNDRQRIQRALEVYRVTGLSMSDWLAQHKPRGLPYHFIRRKLPPMRRAVLHERIEQRFDSMLAAGFVEEVKQLKARGDLTLRHPSMRAVGYRQIWRYLDGEYSLHEARLKGIYATRQLLKRQLTWLRKAENTGINGVSTVN